MRRRERYAVTVFVERAVRELVEAPGTQAAAERLARARLAAWRAQFPNGAVEARATVTRRSDRKVVLVTPPFPGLDERCAPAASAGAVAVSA